MKTLTLSSHDVGFQAILDQARSEDIVVKLADGSEFFIAAVDEFDDELTATRKNEKLMAFLDCRAARHETVPLEEIQCRVARTDDGDLCADNEREFAKLAAKWKAETKLMSNITKRAIHPAYQKIIGMGEAAVPLILRDLEENGPHHWFWALTAITGENPITEDIAGDIAAMTEAWLKWGTARGYRTSSIQTTKRPFQASETRDIE